MLQKSLCSAAALVAMAFLFGSAFASPLGAGTRGTVPLEPMLLQVIRCRRICHHMVGHLCAGQSVATGSIKSPAFLSSC